MRSAVIIIQVQCCMRTDGTLPPTIMEVEVSFTIGPCSTSMIMRGRVAGKESVDTL